MTNENNTIHMVQKEAYFSSTNSKDKFKIELQGKDILSGVVKFEIFTSQGKSIYSVMFESKRLLGYGLAENATKSQREQFIINRMDTFFSDGNFIKPAIDSKLDFDPEDFDLIDRNTWSEISENKESIGFQYTLGEEDMTWIVYLKKSNKVIKYKACC